MGDPFVRDRQFTTRADEVDKAAQGIIATAGCLGCASWVVIAAIFVGVAILIWQAVFS